MKRGVAIQTIWQRVGLFFLVVAMGLMLSSVPQARSNKPLYYAQPPDAVIPKVKVVDYSPLVSKIKPSVFNISVTGKQEVISNWLPRQKREKNKRHFRNPFEFFFDHDLFPYRLPWRPHRQVIPVRSSGSGFLINERGYALTNHHVVKDAKKIVASLEDGREFAIKVIGKSSLIDLALVKLQAPKGTSLPFAYLGSSEALKVGEPVLAIGNAKGLGLTVTAGIISAKGRVIGSGAYDDYIQTDAAINRGNSGGPLFNLRGQVVGINTAILADGQNIGFAIPIDLVKQVLPQLMSKGKIERAQLGVLVQKMTPALAKAFGLKKPYGALVSKVVKGSAAERSGIQVGDVILKIGGRLIRNHHHLPLMVAFQPPGQKVTLEILRKNKRIQVSVVLQKWTEDKQTAQAQESDTLQTTVLGRLGIKVKTLAAKLRKRWKIPTKQGVQISEVRPDSQAAQEGMREGDIILECNNTLVRSPAHLKSLLAKVKSGQTVLFLLRREHAALFIAFTLD